MFDTGKNFISRKQKIHSCERDFENWVSSAWRDVSQIKNMCCSCREHIFSSPYLYITSTNICHTFTHAGT